MAARLNWRWWATRPFVLLGLTVLVVVTLGPFYWILVSSFRFNRELISDHVSLWPHEWTTSNFRTLLQNPVFVGNLKNSAFVTGITLGITLVLAILGSYALRRFEFPGRRLMQHSTLLPYMFPAIVLLTPLYEVAARLHLINSAWSLVLVYVAFTAPFSLWLIETFFHSIPVDVEEAATMESAGRLRILKDIYLPLIFPGLVSAAAFTIVYSWSEYMFAVTFLNDQAKMTLPISLNLFTSVMMIDWGVVSAGAIVAALPVVVVFALFGPTFLRNMTKGAVK